MKQYDLEEAAEACSSVRISQVSKRTEYGIFV